MTVKYVIAGTVQEGQRRAVELNLRHIPQIITSQEKLRGIEPHEEEYEIVHSPSLDPRFLEVLRTRLR